MLVEYAPPSTSEGGDIEMTGVGWSMGPPSTSEGGDIEMTGAGWSMGET